MTNIGGDGHRPVGRGGRVLLRRAATCPTASMMPLKVRSMVGLIPLFAVETLEPELLERAARVHRPAASGSSNYRPDLAQLVSRWEEPGTGERRLLSLLRGHRMKRLLAAHARRDASSSPTTACARCRGTTTTSRTCSTATGRTLACRYEPGESRLGPVRRQLELARADLVPGQLPDHRVAAEVPPLLRRRLQGRVPDRLRAVS